jgi:hypothetical protein
MADDVLRPEILTGLTRPSGLSPTQGDALLDATPAERLAASRLLLERSRELLQQAGVLPPSRSVLDVGYGQLQALAAVFVVADRWWNQPGLVDRSLGDLCKVIPAGEADQIMRILRWAGFLPPEPPVQGEGE